MSPHFTALLFQFISSTGPFFPITPTEAFCLTRSHLQSDIRMKDRQKSHFSSFSPNVCFSWQILCFVELCFRACNSLLWINSGSTRPWPSQRSPPFSLLHQSHRIWGSACCSIQANLPWIRVPAKCLKCKMGTVGPQAGRGSRVLVWKTTRLACIKVNSLPEQHETWLQVVKMNHVQPRFSTPSTRHKQY